jgi:RNA-directed DNA polymerase
LHSKLLRSVHRYDNLERAWQAIRNNARTSKSDDVRKEVEQFNENAGPNLRSLSARLGKGTFKFQPAKGVPISKINAKGQIDKDKFRPIVLAVVGDRIVQRAVLEVLCGIPALEPYFKSSYSFGGLRKSFCTEQEAAGVHAAAKTVLDEIMRGAQFAMSADIEGFFTKISKSSVLNIISEVVQDHEFTEFLRKAITVELSNLAELREKKTAFPIEDIGVAQGNSLSPLLGNIILSEFDRELNLDDCRCVRYIDDFIILAPKRAAAIARLKKARQILGDLGMELSTHKTSKEPFSLQDNFDFLGIEFANGYLRPAKKPIAKLMKNIHETLRESEKSFFARRRGKTIKKANSLIATLKQVDGKVQGWGKHYRFCNDDRCFAYIDAKIAKRIGEYLGAYKDERSRLPPEARWEMLGIQELHKISRQPLLWPKRAQTL